MTNTDDKMVGDYYALYPDVFLVEGVKRHCLYDLHKGDLYNISNKIKNLIINITQETGNLTALNPEEKDIIVGLVNHHLLVNSQKNKSYSNILSLRQSFPLEFAWIEVTKQCNLKCQFCYEESHPCREERMNLTDFYYVVDELKDIGVKAIQLIGGEPFTLQDTLKSMIQFSSKKFSHLEVFTNGTFIDNPWCLFIKDHDVIVSLSVHSYIPEEHDQITQVRGSHSRTLKAIELLEKHNIKYRIAAVKTNGCNIGTCPTNSIYRLRPKNVRLTGRGNIDQYNVDMFREKAITKDKMKFKINKQIIIRHISGHQCFSKDLYISTNMDVFPCAMERRFKHGNLRDNKLKNIINQDICSLSKDHVTDCRSCEYRYICFDCRPDSNGCDKYSKPWYCTYNPRTGEWTDLETAYQKLNQSQNSDGHYCYSDFKESG